MEVKDHAVVFAILFKILQGISVVSLVEGARHHMFKACSFLAGELSLGLASFVVDGHLTHITVVGSPIRFQAAYTVLSSS